MGSALKGLVFFLELMQRFYFSGEGVGVVPWSLSWDQLVKPGVNPTDPCGDGEAAHEQGKGCCALALHPQTCPSGNPTTALSPCSEFHSSHFSPGFAGTGVSSFLNRAASPFFGLSPLRASGLQQWAAPPSWGWMCRLAAL